MSFIQVNKIALRLGLKKEYTLIHFSDTHAIIHSQNDSLEGQKLSLERENDWISGRKSFADYFKEKCDDEQMIKSKDCLSELIKYSNNENPSATIMTGDMIDFYSEYNYKFLIDEISNIKNPYLFTCGNHETPVNQYEKIIASTGFKAIEFEDLLLIGVDDSTKKISLPTLNLLKKELSKNKATIICMHIPIKTKNNELEMQKYDQYFIIDSENTDETTKEFCDILIHNDNIKMILCGHTHGHGESEIAPLKKQYCASSGLIGYVNKITIY